MVQVPKLRPRKPIKPMMTIELVLFGLASTVIMIFVISAIVASVF